MWIYYNCINIKTVKIHNVLCIMQYFFRFVSLLIDTWQRWLEVVRDGTETVEVLFCCSFVFGARGEVDDLFFVRFSLTIKSRQWWLFSLTVVAQKLRFVCYFNLRHVDVTSVICFHAKNFQFQSHSFN